MGKKNNRKKKHENGSPAPEQEQQEAPEEVNTTSTTTVGSQPEPTPAQVTTPPVVPAESEDVDWEFTDLHSPNQAMSSPPSAGAATAEPRSPAEPAPKADTAITIDEDRAEKKEPESTVPIVVATSGTEHTSKKKAVTVKSPPTQSQDKRDRAGVSVNDSFFGRRSETELYEDGELPMEEEEGFPTWFFRCLWEMIKIALPVTFSVSLTNAAFVFTIYFAAHTLPKLEFAGLAMGLSFSNISANALGAGLSCALDTLCSQEHGRDPKSKRIGLYLQRAFLGTFVLFTPLSVLYCFSEPVLSALIQPDIAHYAAYWLKFSVVVSLPTVLTTCVQKYVQCHGDSVIVLYSSMLGCISVPFFLTHLAQYGMNGFLLALCLNRTSVLLLLILFSVRKPELQATWPGFTMRAARWRAMRRYFIVGMPSMAAFCADLWGFEAMAVMAGHLGATQVAVWMIVINIQGLCWGPCVGICSAAAVRVGNALGAGKPIEAQRMLKGAIVLSIIIGTVCGGITIFFGDSIVHLLQRDPEVIERALKVLRFNGCALFLDIQFYVLQGIYRGCGKQSLAAKLVAFGHWCIGIPLSAALSLYYDYQVKGILIGFITGMLCVIPIFVYHLFFKFDWIEMAKVISIGPMIMTPAISTEPSEGAGGKTPPQRRNMSARHSASTAEAVPLVGIIKKSDGSRNSPSAEGGTAPANYGGTNERADLERADSNISTGSASRRRHHLERRDSEQMMRISPSLGPASGETVHGSTAGGTVTGGMGNGSQLLDSVLADEAESPTTDRTGGGFPKAIV